MTAYLDCVEINPSGEPSAVVIWLHGLGADGHDFEAIVPELHMPETLAIRYLFPHAPMRPVTINGGMVMRAWYDIVDMNLGRKVAVNDILESCRHINALIQREEQAGIPSSRILLAGFSQGGAIILHAGLRYPHPLAGLAALSTYSPTLDTLPGEHSRENSAIPILMAHGTYDPMIPISNGKQTYRSLKELNYSVEWHEYPMEHQVCMEEIQDIREWMLAVLAQS